MITPGELAIVSSYYFFFLLLTVYALHRLHLVRLRRRLDSPPSEYLTGDDWPHLAVQLPLYNEPNVARRLIDAAAALDYPGRLEIQVLDDSTDHTTAIVAQRVAVARARGVEIHHVRRTNRQGFKAGALAAGMNCTDAELFAIFDADFLPQSQALKELVPPFRDLSVGMVQARWGHLNREESVLTRMQALVLDGHFAVESAARYLDGRFFNFNGTAGVWRRQAILDAGGWSASTLTEDLDLSYRAQLAGWKFVFLPHLEIPAELPALLGGFQGQQHRWAKGSIQTARKLLGRILAARVPLKLKIEAFFHLTNNLAYLLTLLLALLLVPALEIRYRVRFFPVVCFDLTLFLISSYALVAFCREGQKQVGRPVVSWKELVLLLPVGISLSVTNATAVLEGLILYGGEFHRTHKRGWDMKNTSVERPPKIPLIEAILAGFFLLAVVVFIACGRWAGLPFVLLFLTGYLYGLTLSALEWVLYLRRDLAVSAAFTED